MVSNTSHFEYFQLLFHFIVCISQCQACGALFEADSYNRVIMFNWIPCWSFSAGFLSEVNAKVNGSNSIVCWDASGLGTAPFRMFILIAISNFLMQKCLKMLHLLCTIFLITSVVIINQKPLKFKWKAISAYYVKSFMEIVVVGRTLKLCPFLILQPLSGTLCNIWDRLTLCKTFNELVLLFYITIGC